MSTRYKRSRQVPIDVLADRLDLLSDALVTRMKGDSGSIERECTCRIPAEHGRDLDLVLSAAADRLREYRAIKVMLDAFEEQQGN